MDVFAFYCHSFRISLFPALTPVPSPFLIHGPLSASTWAPQPGCVPSLGLMMMDKEAWARWWTLRGSLLGDYRAHVQTHVLTRNTQGKGISPQGQPEAPATLPFRRRYLQSFTLDQNR